MIMKYNNPIIKGFYPDPSVCRAGERFYLVCSTFQYMPGVPVFESEDLINWNQIGNALTRPSQVDLASVPSSGGVFAPTIRYHKGRFYMVTTNDTLHKNFYVYTDDITGEWSEPIFVDQGGIDPSLLFDNGKVYFTSNGGDDFGDHGVTQCEIDIETGRKLTPSKTIWHGTGGRYLESPHLYKIGSYYYLTAAEGGTEYGHMIVCARSKNPMGPFENCPNNPVLTNRNKGGFEIQGAGHGDLIQSASGEWFIIHLAFRQIGQYEMYHHLGREVYMVPVHFDDDGWFTCGNDGTTEFEYDIDAASPQAPIHDYTLSNIDRKLMLLYLRDYKPDNYILDDSCYTLKGDETTIDMPGSPTFIGIRQQAMNGSLSCKISVLGKGEAGITIYMDENHHYDLLIRKEHDACFAVLMLNIGNIKHKEKIVPLKNDSAMMSVQFTSHEYNFYVNDEFMGTGLTRYLSSEVAGGFTGVLFGMYAQGDITANYTDYLLKQ